MAFRLGLIVEGRLEYSAFPIWIPKIRGFCGSPSFGSVKVLKFDGGPQAALSKLRPRTNEASQHVGLLLARMRKALAAMRGFKPDLVIVELDFEQRDGAVQEWMDALYPKVVQSLEGCCESVAIAFAVRTIETWLMAGYPYPKLRKMVESSFAVPTLDTVNGHGPQYPVRKIERMIPRYHKVRDGKRVFDSYAKRNWSEARRRSRSFCMLSDIIGSA